MVTARHVRILPTGQVTTLASIDTRNTGEGLDWDAKLLAEIDPTDQWNPLTDRLVIDTGRTTHVLKGMPPMSNDDDFTA